MTEPKNPIRFRCQLVTPTQAQQMLQKNSGNRKVRPGTIARYARDMRNGRWQVTHQCLAFDVNGNIIDGQHRLLAQVQANVPLWWYVARYSVESDAMAFILDGQATRSAVDVLGCQKKDQETARMIFVGARRAPDYRSPTIPEIEQILAAHGDVIEATTAAAKTSRRTPRSQAAVRAAFAVAICSSPKERDELCGQLASFVELNAAMWPSLTATVRLFESKGDMGNQWYMKRVFWALKASHRETARKYNEEAGSELLGVACRKVIGELA